MIEKIMEDIYKIIVPLPDNPLGSLNSYLILGGRERNLLIDTGFNHPLCRSVILDAFHQLGARLSDTDFFLTHLHADHSGLAAELAEEGAKIYCSEQDGRIVNLFASQSYWDEMSAVFSKHGMPDIKLDKKKGVHPGKLFGGRKEIDFTFVRDNDMICSGKHRLRCVWTPGHSPGHMCLYDEKEKLLFSGDHILGDITPVITVEKGMERPLSFYLESLDRIKKLEIERILTGHRGSVGNAYHRIEELKSHHASRLQEIIDILKSTGSSLNAYAVAAKMTWRMDADQWENIPRQQRWFATGEAMAHLLYLQEKGVADCRFRENSYLFFLASRECGEESS